MTIAIILLAVNMLLLIINKNHITLNNLKTAFVSSLVIILTYIITMNDIDLEIIYLIILSISTILTIMIFCISIETSNPIKFLCIANIFTCIFIKFFLGNSGSFGFAIIEYIVLHFLLYVFLTQLIILTIHNIIYTIRQSKEQPINK